MLHHPNHGVVVTSSKYTHTVTRIETCFGLMMWLGMYLNCALCFCLLVMAAAVNEMECTSSLVHGATHQSLVSVSLR